MCLSVCFCERAHICAVIADWWSCGVRGPIVYPLSVCVCVYAIEWHLPPAHRRVVVNQCANHISCLPNPINSTAKIDRKYIANTTIARAQHTHIHTNTHPASTMSKKQILHPRVTNEIIEIKSKVSPPSLHLHPHSLRSFFVCVVYDAYASHPECSVLIHMNASLYIEICTTNNRNIYMRFACVSFCVCVCSTNAFPFCENAAFAGRTQHALEYMASWTVQTPKYAQCAPQYLYLYLPSPPSVLGSAWIISCVCVSKEWPADR